MFFVLIFTFVILPMLELSVLIKAGTLWGVGNTLLLIVLTGVLGAALARQQGLRVLFEVQKDLSRGVMPTDKLVDGLLILVAGVVLLTPGFITDAIGFLVLWPTGRGWLKKRIAHVMQNRYVRTITTEVTIEDE
jgi:UPF0716 protein FxsA